MFIKKILSIENYRNLSGIQFHFDAEINFIVGENNIGKTNLIELLNRVIKDGKFSKDDFYDIKKSIKITFIIEYNEDELGFFESIFDIEEEHSITITAFQENVDSRIEYWHAESGASINPRMIRMLNFIYYSSLRYPSKELNFTGNIGTGKVLNYIMEKSLSNRSLDQMDLLNVEDIKEVISDVNNKLIKLNGFSDDKIEAYLSQDKKNIIQKLVEIGDNTGTNISKLGDGLQYSFNIFLNILELVVHLKNTKKQEDFENLLINDEEGKKYLPIIIALDEPEIHQHPYRQRALIKIIRNIIDNKNEKFIELINELFDFDGFIGQVFVATHSPNILLNNYKQIIRFYKQKNNVTATSGSDINFTTDIHKHLIRSFIYFKEAMFAKSVILVEGDTEFGAVPIFAESLGYDLDSKCVGIVKLDGADAVLKYLELFRAFKIYAIAILDKDKQELYKDNPFIKFTTGEDFEEDIFSEYTFKNYIKYLIDLGNYSFLVPIIKSKIEDFNPAKFINNPSTLEIETNIDEEIISQIRENEINKLRGVKNALNGAALAIYANSVPESYKNVIVQAVEVSMND